MQVPRPGAGDVAVSSTQGLARWGLERAGLSRGFERALGCQRLAESWQRERVFGGIPSRHREPSGDPAGDGDRAVQPVPTWRESCVIERAGALQHSTGKGPRVPLCARLPGLLCF